MAYAGICQHMPVFSTFTLGWTKGYRHMLAYASICHCRMARAEPGRAHSCICSHMLAYAKHMPSVWHAPKRCYCNTFPNMCGKHTLVGHWDEGPHTYTMATWHLMGCYCKRLNKEMHHLTSRLPSGFPKNVTDPPYILQVYNTPYLCFHAFLKYLLHGWDP